MSYELDCININTNLSKIQVWNYSFPWTSTRLSYVFTKYVELEASFQLLQFHLWLWLTSEGVKYLNHFFGNPEIRIEVSQEKKWKTTKSFFHSHQTKVKSRSSNNKAMFFPIIITYTLSHSSATSSLTIAKNSNDLHFLIALYVPK